MLEHRLQLGFVFLQGLARRGGLLLGTLAPQSKIGHPRGNHDGDQSHGAGIDQRARRFRAAEQPGFRHEAQLPQPAFHGQQNFAAHRLIPCDVAIGHQHARCTGIGGCRQPVIAHAERQPSEIVQPSHQRVQVQGQRHQPGRSCLALTPTHLVIQGHEHHDLRAVLARQRGGGSHLPAGHGTLCALQHLGQRMQFLPQQGLMARGRPDEIRDQVLGQAGARMHRKIQRHRTTQMRVHGGLRLEQGKLRRLHAADELDIADRRQHPLDIHASRRQLKIAPPDVRALLHQIAQAHQQAALLVHMLQQIASYRIRAEHEALLRQIINLAAAVHPCGGHSRHPGDKHQQRWQPVPPSGARER